MLKLWVLFVYCRSQRLSWPSVVLGEEQQCRERVASSLALLVQSVLVCEVQGFFSLTLCSKILSEGPVLLPGESQEQGSLVGCRLWGRTE